MAYEFNLNPRKVSLVQTKNRKICTPIPNPETLPNIFECIKYEPLSMNDQLPVVWHRARDYNVYDISGNCWIDFTSTIFVANVGHSNESVLTAIKNAVDQNLLNAYYYQTGYRLELVKKLVQICPANLNKVLLLSTGSESTEATIKCAMNYGRRIHPDKDIILGFKNSFHGKTMGSQTLGGKDAGKKWIKYFHPRIMHLDYPYPWVLEELKMTGEEFFYHNLKQLEKDGVKLEEIAAIFAEPYQGWCAVFLPKDYVHAARKWCDKNNTLLGFDEIQSGFGRTGKMFGYEHFDVTPDVIWCGKAISSSLPVSAVIANESFFGNDASLNSTHGGNPIGAAASVASIDFLIKNSLIEKAEKQGHLIREFLYSWRNEFPNYIHEIFGNGMVWAVFIRHPDTKELAIDLVDKIIERAMEKGVLSIRTCSGTLKLGPPLTITDDALLEGLNVLKESMAEVIK